MKLRDIQRGQDYLMRAVRHLANRASVIREGQIYWLIGPEAEADGIMTACWRQLDAIATRGGQPRRSKAMPAKKNRERHAPISAGGVS
jgi:hypothetical protein